MMKLPIILLSYGNFATTKKLVSYDRHGEHLIPIFTNLNQAEIFARGIRKLAKEVGDTREILCQVCNKWNYAIDMFTTIGTLSTEPPGVIINPARPDIVVGQVAAKTIRLMESKKSIGELLEMLYESRDSEMSKQE